MLIWYFLQGWEAGQKGFKRPQLCNQTPSVRIWDPLSIWIRLRNRWSAAILYKAVITFVGFGFILSSTFIITFLYSNRIICGNINSFIIVN